MLSHPVKQVIEAADRAIVAEDFDALMSFYADNAVLVVRPAVYAKGKSEIRAAFVRIADYFSHSLVVKQGNMLVIEDGDTALAISDTLVDFVDENGSCISTTRRGTYVFKKSIDGRRLCAIDNSYGTDLLNAV